MKIVNMQKAKTHLSKLVAAAAEGDEFIIARAGKPLVKVVPFTPKGARRLGFLEGKGTVPDDFDQMGTEEIARTFTR